MIYQILATFCQKTPHFVMPNFIGKKFLITMAPLWAAFGRYLDIYGRFFGPNVWPH
jgi:hypothetical protein